MRPPRRLLQTSMWKRMVMHRAGSFPLVSKRLVTKSLFCFSVDGSDCLYPVRYLAWGDLSLEPTDYFVELMVASRRAHTRQYFPGLLQPVSLSLYWATATASLYSPLEHYQISMPWVSQVALVVKNLPANPGNVWDVGSIPRLGRSPGRGHGNSLQFSYLLNPMDRGAWWTTVYSVTKSWTWRSNLACMHACMSGLVSFRVTPFSSPGSPLRNLCLPSNRGVSDSPCPTIKSLWPSKLGSLGTPLPGQAPWTGTEVPWNVLWLGAKAWELESNPKVGTAVDCR